MPTGSMPTATSPPEVVVGDAQQLSILKEVSVVGGGAAQPGSQLEYVIRVTNIGSLPATHVVVTDDLGPLAGQVSYVDGSGTLNGLRPPESPMRARCSPPTTPPGTATCRRAPKPWCGSGCRSIRRWRSGRPSPIPAW